jgi:hypothetical protein
MPQRIIGLVGAKGCGKSTLAAQLQPRGFTRLPFAEPLKLMLTALLAAQNLDAQGIDDMLNGHAKEIPTRLLAGRTPRYAMQTLGTEWGRELIANDFWLRVWERRVSGIAADIVVEDVRFSNEVDLIQRYLGVVVQITRQSQVESADGHASEKLAKLLIPDITITNFEGESQAMLRQLEEHHVI